MNSRRRLASWCLPSVTIIALIAGGLSDDRAGREALGRGASTPSPCRVTAPNGDRPPESQGGDGGYGNDALWTNLWMWGEGEVLVPPSHVLPDGSFGPMKWAWYRYTSGKIEVTGRRLDAPAPPLQDVTPDGYGNRGFQVSGLIFPTEGCWEITGSIGNDQLRFVTLVIAPKPVVVRNATPKGARRHRKPVRGTSAMPIRQRVPARGMMLDRRLRG